MSTEFSRTVKVGKLCRVSRDITVGIIGGGQLARMLYEAASPLGIPVRLLAEDHHVCAALVVHDVTVGDYTDADTVADFARTCDVVTFDHEHVPTSILKQLEADGVHVRPGPHALVYAQDKALMRAKMDELGAPNPRWRVVDSAQDLIDFAEVVGWPMIAKTSRGGYDGHGVFKLNGPADATIPFDRAPKISAGEKVVIIAEEFVDFTRELSALVVRSACSDVVTYPISQTLQEDGICVETITPAPRLDEETQRELQEMARRIAVDLDVVGVLAVEMMERADGSVVINELAMRPHNTGHWTIDGAVGSQFTNHLLAVLGLPLMEPGLCFDHVVMRNILGGSVDDLTGALKHCLATDPRMRPHFYAKEMRRGRKVGHVTTFGTDEDDVLSRARAAANYLMGVSDE